MPTTPKLCREQLPKFIIGDDAERDFVIHTQTPCFILEFVGQSGVPVFIDSESDFIANELANGREPSRTLARLLREAGDYFLQQTCG